MVIVRYRKLSQALVAWSIDGQLQEGEASCRPISLLLTSTALYVVDWTDDTLAQALAVSDIDCQRHSHTTLHIVTSTTVTIASSADNKVCVFCALTYF